MTDCIYNVLGIGNAIVDILADINDDFLSSESLEKGSMCLADEAVAKKIISKKNINIQFKVIEPVGYLEMIWLIKNCNGVITDSGGLQKEAFFFDKKCITMRTETEWVELIELGVNELVGYDIEKIISASNKLDNFPKLDVYPYGSGNTSEIIINSMLNLI